MWSSEHRGVCYEITCGRPANTSMASVVSFIGPVCLQTEHTQHTWVQPSLLTVYTNNL